MERTSLQYVMLSNSSRKLHQQLSDLCLVSTDQNPISWKW